MSDFSFGNISVNSRKQILNLDTYDSPLLIDKSKVRANYSKPIVFLVEEQYNKKELEYIDNFLKEQHCPKYIILNTLNCVLEEKEMKEGVIKFYTNNRSDFMKYIPYGSPVVTSGYALYGLLMEDDIYPNYVNQMNFGKTSFWFSLDLTQETCHRIFPISSFKRDIFGHDLFKKWATAAVKSYKTNIAIAQISKALKYTDIPIPEYPKLNKVFIESSDDFYARFYLANKARTDMLAWDTETSGLHFFKNEVGCITLSFDGKTGYYVPWRVMNYQCKEELDEIFGHCTQITANGKFDCKFLWKPRKTLKYNAQSLTSEYIDFYFKNARIDEDIIQLGHTLDETRSNTLKTLTTLYTIYGGYERPLDEYKAKMGGNINYLDIPEDILREYAVMDAICTRLVYDELIKHVRELDANFPNEFSDHGMEYYYRTFKMPAERMYAKIEYEGVYVDKKALDKVRHDIIEDIENTKKKLSEEFKVSNDFPWGSDTEIGKLLEKQGWEDLGRTKSGCYAVGKYQLKRWEKNHPETKDIQTFKSYTTLLNTFIGDDTKNSTWAELNGENDEEGTKGWTAHLVYHPEDKSWRMHPSFLSMMTDSGRSRCTAPNMQQVPTRGKYSEEIKSCIITPNNDDYYMVTVDYSALQMRLCGIDVRHIDKTDNGTKGFVETLLEGRNVDMHSQTAYNVFYRGRQIDIETIEIEQDGKHYTFLGGEQVKTKNRGEVFACELKEEDILDLR